MLAVLFLGSPHAASADSLPTIVNVKLDPQNHAVVTWTKEPWQGSVNVKWAKDGTLGTYGDGSYGSPLADCQVNLRSNPAGDSQWLYGSTCKGDDVADTDTTHVTREAMQVGVYYFQVGVRGESHESGNPCRYDAPGNGECLNSHYSGIAKLTVTSSGGKPTQPGGPNVTEEAGTIAEAIVTGKATVSEPLERGKPVTGELAIHDLDEIETGASRAKLSFKGGPVLALDKRSTVMFFAFPGFEGGGRGVSVDRGRVWYSLKGTPKVFFKRVNAGGGAVLAPRAATFTIQVTHRGESARVRVYSGTVTVGSFNSDHTAVVSRVRVGQGFETVLEEDHAPTKPSKLTSELPFWK